MPGEGVLASSDVVVVRTRQSKGCLVKRRSRMSGMFDREQLGGEMELGVMRKARTLLEDGCAHVGMALDITVASRQRHNEAHRDAARMAVGRG